MKILLYLLLPFTIFAMQTSDKLFECTEIFQERKGELLVELERIDEQKQALESLKIATEELLKVKESKLTLQEESLNQKVSEITNKEKSIKKMLEKNSLILKETKNLKMSKIAQTFSKMKAAASAGILGDMDPKEALLILQSLKPKTGKPNITSFKIIDFFHNLNMPELSLV